MSTQATTPSSRQRDQRAARRGTNILTPQGDRGAGDAQQNQSPPPPQNQNINPNIIVQSSAFDTYVPVVRRVNKEDVQVAFQHQQLDPIDGEPTFDEMQHLEKQLASNALTAKVSFGGGKKGCLGVVYSNAKFHVESGHDWIVPQSQGAFPFFPPQATDDEKKKIIAKFLQDEHDIQVVDICEELLKKQLVGAVNEDYLLELKEGISEYSGVPLRDIIRHLRTEYAPMTDLVYQDIMKRFRQPPDMDSPIDRYFAKQEECRLLSQDSEDPITDKGMVIQLTTHMGETGLINKIVTKFRKQSDPALKTWAKGKAWMRKALKELKDETKLAGQDGDYQANNVRCAPATKPAPADAHIEARDEIAGQMRDSFSSLAQAAVAKAETIDAHAATISSLTNTIAELTATNKQLVKALAAAKAAPAPGVRAPPGFTSPNLTGHAQNSLGETCPTKKWTPDGRWQFVNKQYCSTCKNMVNHIPKDCHELPGNEDIKAKWEARNAKKRAKRNNQQSKANE